MVDLDRQARLRKAEKIISILADAAPERLARARCLDLGCGIGVLADRLRPLTGQVVGLDSELSLLRLASADLSRGQGDALRLPFGDATFDLVVCAQVYEHVADAAALAAEVARVLKPGGICFFSGPNRLWPYEYHYRAWLAHWLPDRWLEPALRLLHRQDADRVRLRTWWGLRRLWRGFTIRDYTTRALRDPERFPGTGAPGWLRHVPAALLSPLACFVPNVNWVLTKSEGH